MCENFKHLDLRLSKDMVWYCKNCDTVWPPNQTPLIVLDI